MRIAASRGNWAPGDHSTGRAITVYPACMTEPLGPSPAEPTTGQPTTGYLVPPRYGHGPFAGPRPTNGLAIASLAASLVMLTSIPPLTVIGAILGHMARRQIRETNEEGAGLALAGIIVGWIGFVLSLAAIALIIIWARSGFFDETS